MAIHNARPAPPTPSAHALALALDFSQGLHAQLTQEQMTEVVRRNRSVAAPSVCHLHDFCDANMVLYEVYVRHGMDLASKVCMERHGTSSSVREPRWRALLRA